MRKIKTTQSSPTFGIILLLLVAFNITCSFAQNKSSKVQIILEPITNSWDYTINEQVELNVMVMRDSISLQNISIYYEYGLEGMPAEFRGTTITNGTNNTISIGTLTQPGFKRCIAKTMVDDVEYSSMITVAYSPEKIKPTIEEPNDFDTFWEDAIAAMRKSESNIKKTISEKHSTAETEVSLLQFSVPNSKVSFYGYLSKPKKEGKYPVILYLPGAGIDPLKPMINFINKDAITLNIEIHGLNPESDPNIFVEMRKKFMQYMYTGLESRDNYYFKPVILGCIKAADYLCEMEEYDGRNFISFGGSQGGFLAIATAALDKRVSKLVAFHPAMSDLSGYFHNRVGGWPHFFAHKFNGIYNNEVVKETLTYFDTVNFAKRVSVAGFYSFGYNDVTCPPTTCYAVINSIEAPKNLFLTPTTGHWRIPEMMTESSNWVIEKLEQ